MRGVCAIHGSFIGRRCPDPAHRRQKPRSRIDEIRSTALWQKIRRLAAQRDGHRCTYGLEPGDRGTQAYDDGRCPVTAGLDGHHRVAIEDGGEAYDLDNVRTVCGTHHVQLEAERRRARRPA